MKENRNDGNISLKLLGSSRTGRSQGVSGLPEDGKSKSHARSATLVV